MLAACVFGSSAAAAQDLTTVPGLQDRLEHERSVSLQLLDAGECPRACLALEAMRQAADRLCQMDAGTPGIQGRSRLEETAQVVGAQCPDCEEVVAIEHPTPAQRSEVGSSAACSHSSPPPPEAPSGGCASCGIAQQSNSEAAPSGALVALLMFAAAGRRIRKRRHSK